MCIDMFLIMEKSKGLLLFDIDDVLFHTQRFIDSGLTDFQLYEDVLTTLDSVSENFEIGVLSQGGFELQMRKLLETGISERFKNENIYIVEKKDETLKETLKPYCDRSPIWFIDDRVTGLFYAKEALPQLKTIRLKRGRHIAIEQEIDGFTPDFTVSGLSEVPPILE